MREHLISSDHKNEQYYALVKMDGSSARWGDFKLFEMSKRVEDDIPNRLLQWLPSQSIDGGTLTQVEDPMLARDTWVNHFFAGHKVHIGRTKLETRVNYTLFHQLMDERTRKELELRKSDFFFGAINKIRYRRQIGALTVEPRWKSEFLKQTRGLFGEERREQLRELFSVIVEMDFLTDSTLQGGLEYLWNEDFAEDANDFRSVSLGLQLTNRSTLPRV